MYWKDRSTVRYLFKEEVAFSATVLIYAVSIAGELSALNQHHLINTAVAILITVAIMGLDGLLYWVACGVAVVAGLLLIPISGDPTYSVSAHAFVLINAAGGIAAGQLYSRGKDAIREKSKH